EQFLTYNATPLALHSGIRAKWLKGTSDDRFWYLVLTETGSESFLVDAAKRTRVPCELAECNEEEAALRDRVGAMGRVASKHDVPSPDGKRTAFIRDWNLWVRDVPS